jgi:hypothetical protein
LDNKFSTTNISLIFALLKKHLRQNLYSIRQRICWRQIFFLTLSCYGNMKATLGFVNGKAKGKAILVRGRRGPQGCETSRLPHLLDTRFKMTVKL